MAKGMLGGLVWALVSLALLLGGCLEFESRQCANGVVCPPGTRCSPNGSCSAVVFGCGNGEQGDGEECDDGNLASGDGCTASCLLEVCGNGAIDVVQTESGLVQAEECDDGNPLSLDGCSASCELTAGTWEGYGDPLHRPGASGVAYDIGRRRAVIFDGSRTWEWDGIGWLDVSPLNPADSPGEVSGFQLGYDSAKAKVLLVVGNDAGPTASDTWEWDGVSWRNVRPDQGITPDLLGFLFVMAYDTARERLVLSTGLTLWEWDGRGWQTYTTTDNPLTGGGESVMTYDPKRGEIVLITDTQFGLQVWHWNGARWSLRSHMDGENRPRLFLAAPIAYDPIRDRIVLHQSFDESGSSKTWEWNGASWLDVSPATGQASPPEATGSQMFYDLNEERMLLVVGEVSGEDIGEAVGETGGTWAWDGSQWSDVTPGRRAAAPPASLAPAMAFDGSRGQSILFGGVVGVSEQVNATNQTWAWDGSQWSDVSPIGSAASPEPRFQHAMAYDPTRELVVLFGGVSGTQEAFSDTWEWDGSSWANVTPTLPASVPPTKGDPAMYYDSARQKVVVAVRVGEPETVELWEWDGSVWSEQVPLVGNVPPPGRAKFSMSYDPVRQRAVLFGGHTASGNLQDTWEWDGSSWTQLSPPTSPSARAYHRMAYDAESQQVLLFGGAKLDASPAGLVDEVSQESWAWGGITWTQLEPSGPVPGPRGTHAMAYDSSRGRLVVFGGASHHFLGDTWELEGTAWQDLTSRPADLPLPREFATMNDDAARGSILLFGGFATDGFSNELWERNLRGWRKLGPSAGETAPEPRMGAASCFDRVRRRLVVFGGIREANGPGLSDTWEWDGETWQVASTSAPPLSPSPRVFADMTFDATRGTCILFGGQSGAFPSFNGAGATFYSDTWEWNGSSWIDISPISGPSPRSRHQLEYDVGRQRVVLFGGSDPSEVELGDTWEWDGSEWVDVTPQQIDESPPAMMDFGMTYDSNLRKTVLLGGHGGPLSDTSIPDQGDVWVWDGKRWTKTAEASSSATPPARLGHMMAYDAARGRTIVFGGNRNIPGGPPYDDTWLYSQKGIGPEQCHSGMDPDLDGLIGCADPDCWGSCTPLCLPYSAPNWPADCDSASSACGDGECNQHLESPRLCPSDCGAPTQICGDVLCDAGEDMTSCPGDCSS